MYVNDDIVSSQSMENITDIENSHGSSVGSSIQQEAWRSPQDTRRRNAKSESLVGSYMARLHRRRFTNTMDASTTVMDGHSTSILDTTRLLDSTDSGTSWWAGVIIMANCTIGMGLLNFPTAIVNAGGIINTLLFQIIILFFIIMSLYMVGRCTQHFGTVSYQDMVTINVGKVAGIICRICIFLNNFGACIVVLVVLGDQWERLMYIIFDTNFCNWWYASRKLFVPVFTAICILPLCFLKSFDVFKYSSFLGVVAAGYVAFGVGLTRLITGVDGAAQGSVHMVAPITTKAIKIIPVICFAYECHIEAPPMMVCLKKPTLNYYMIMVVGYVIVSFVVYSVGGVCGYVTFGNTVHADFILGYARDDPLVVVAMILLSLKIWTTYPVIFFCLRTVVDDVWRRCYHSSSFFNKYWIRRACQTVSLVIATVLISVFVPSISDAIGLIGCISAAFVFIFPGLCYMKMNLQLVQYKTFNGGFLLGSLYVILGVFLLGTTASLAIQEYLHPVDVPENKLCK